MCLMHRKTTKISKAEQVGIFFFNTRRAKFRTCDLTVEAAAGGRINIATVATTTKGCGNTSLFFVFCFHADFARCCPGVRKKSHSEDINISANKALLETGPHAGVLQVLLQERWATFDTFGRHGGEAVFIKQERQR